MSSQPAAAVVPTFVTYAIGGARWLERDEY